MNRGSLSSTHYGRIPPTSVSPLPPSPCPDNRIRGACSPGAPCGSFSTMLPAMLIPKGWAPPSMICKGAPKWPRTMRIHCKLLASLLCLGGLLILYLFLGNTDESSVKGTRRTKLPAPSGPDKVQPTTTPGHFRAIEEHKPRRESRVKKKGNLKPKPPNIR